LSFFWFQRIIVLQMIPVTTVMHQRKSSRKTIYFEKKERMWFNQYMLSLYIYCLSVIWKF